MTKKEEQEILREAEEAYERRFTEWKDKVILMAVLVGVFGIMTILSLGMLIAGAL